MSIFKRLVNPVITWHVYHAAQHVGILVAPYNLPDSIINKHTSKGYTLRRERL